VGVQSRITRRFGIDLDITELFRHPSIRHLAARIESLRDGAAPTNGNARIERASARPNQAGARQQADVRRTARAGSRKAQ